MPIDLEWDELGVTFRCHGLMTGAEAIAANRACYADPRWPKARYQLVDLQGATHAEISDDDMARVAEQERAASAANQQVRFAVVKPKSTDATVSKLVTAWFMAIHDEVAFSIRFAETRDEAVQLLLNEHLV